MISSDFAEGKEVKRDNAQSPNTAWAGSPIEEQGLPQYTLLTAMGGTAAFRQVLWSMNIAGRFLLRTSECGGCLSRATSVFSE